MPDSDSKVLDAALSVFREQGYSAATLDQVAQRAKTDVETLRKQFPDKTGLLTALLTAHSPSDGMITALDAVEGESAEDLLRDAMRRLVKVILADETFVELAAFDVQYNNGTFVSGMSERVFPKAMSLLDRLKQTGQLRPISDPILGRTLVSMLMGFIISERAMPQIARLAMRLFPQRAWLDGMVDLLLFGVLEDNAR